MTGDNVLLQAELVCSENREPLIAQITEMDRRAAGYMKRQLERLGELGDGGLDRGNDGIANGQREALMKSTMDKIHEIAADFVFEHAGSDTEEMAGLFASLSYEGEGKTAKTYMETLRTFGYGGKIENAFHEAGELSDDAIPVIEALHKMQENFTLREVGEDSLRFEDNFFAKSDLRRLEKACESYLDTAEDKKSGEIRAVQMTKDHTAQGETLLRGAGKERNRGGRERISFPDLLREEGNVKPVRRREIGCKSREKEREPMLRVPERQKSGRTPGL